MTDLLNTGKSALFAFQRALATTSHNIANVNTEGYSRQRVDLQAVPGDSRAMRFITGGGVRIASVERIHDQFSTYQVNTTTSAHAEQDALYSMASRLDNLVASDAVSVTTALDDFYASLHDASADASSPASREIVLDRVDQLASRFKTLQDQLDDAQTEVNDRTRQAIKQVGEYASAIAEINNRVVSVAKTQNAQSANDLLDQRDKLVNQIAELVDISTVEQDNGALNVFMDKGISLVIGGRAQSITTQTHDIYPDQLQLAIGEEGNAKTLSTDLQGGEIGGLNEFTTNTLHPAMQELGRLALTLADQLNQQHSRGLDLNGEPGNNLFESATPDVFASQRNTGTAEVSARITDTGSIEASDYRLKFDGLNFTATRISDGGETTGTLPMSLDGLTLTMSGTPAAGDTFIVSAASSAAGSMTTLLTDPDKLALAGQLSTSSDLDNIGDSRISPAEVIDPEAILLREPMNIVFTSETSYDILDANSGATMVAGGSYTEGQTISLNGWEVAINGQAQAGDTHRISPNTQAFNDNSNGLAMAETQMANGIDGYQTFNDAYGSFVSRIGTQTNSAQTRAEALKSLKENAIDRQQSAQGVSLDEEAIDLTRYQQAYQASAQVISVADDLFQSILAAVR